MAQNLKSYLIDGLSESRAFRNDKDRRQKADVFLRSAFQNEYDGMENVPLDDNLKLSANIMIDSISNMQMLAQIRQEENLNVERGPGLYARAKQGATNAITSLKDGVKKFTDNVNDHIDALDVAVGRQVERYDRWLEGLELRTEQRIEAVASMFSRTFDKARSLARDAYYRTAVGFAAGKQAFMGYDNSRPQHGLSEVTVKSFKENVLILKNKLAYPFDVAMLNLPEFPQDSLLGKFQGKVYDRMGKRFDQVNAIERKYRELNPVEMSKSNVTFGDRFTQADIPLEAPIALAASRTEVIDEALSAQNQVADHWTPVTPSFAQPKVVHQETPLVVDDFEEEHGFKDLSGALEEIEAVTDKERGAEQSSVDYFDDPAWAASLEDLIPPDDLYM